MLSRDHVLYSNGVDREDPRRDNPLNLHDPQLNPFHENPLHDPQVKQSVDREDPLRDNPLNLHEPQLNPFHENPLHDPQVKQRCNFCGKEFASVKGRQAHERSETCRRLKASTGLNESLQGGANCLDCGKNFANQMALKSHQMFCKNRPGAMDFKTFSRLNPDKKCKKCEKIFTQMSGLFAHSKFCKAALDAPNLEERSRQDPPDINYSSLDDSYSHDDYMDNTEPPIDPNVYVIKPAAEIKTEPNDVHPSEKPDVVKVIRPNSSPFIKVLPSLKHDDLNHDVTLVSSDRNLVTCHAAVVAAASPYFAQLLRNALAEDENVLIMAENMTSKDVKNFIDFLYMGKIRKSKEEVNDLKKILGEFRIKFSPEMLINSDDWFDNDNGSANDIADSGNMEIEVDMKDYVGHFGHSNGNSIGAVAAYEPLEDFNVDSYNTDQNESADDEDYVPKKKKLVKKKESKKLGKRGRPKKGTVENGHNTLELKSVCDYCDLKFKTLFHTMKHVEETHGDMFEEFAKIHIQTQCEHCEEKFLNKRCLSSHKQMKHPEIPKPKVSPGPKRKRGTEDGLPYKADRMCPHCPRILRDIDAYEDHVQAHLAGTDHPFSCEECGRRFQRSLKLRQHKKKHKISETPLLCNLCGSIFQTEFEYRKHSRTHIPLFRKPVSRKTPEKKPLDDNTSFLCNLCGQNFSSKYKYKSHINRAHIEPEERLTCPHCPTTFVNISILKRHIQLHLPPTIQCQFCEKKFHTNVYLRTHIRTKHTADNLKDYVCGQCGKGFISKDGYEGHLNMHAGIKPFKCRYCEMCYQNKSNRHAHEKSRHPDLFVKIRTDNLGGVPVNKR